jgi:hypothetical protein
MRRKILWAALTAAVALTGTAYAASPEYGPKPRVIKLVEASENVQPAFIDIGAPGPSVGDRVVVRDGVNRENGQPAGSLTQDCALVLLGSNPLTSTYECVGSLTLPEGVITHHGPFVPAAAEQTVAVTGGTGAFKTARGELSIRTEDDKLVVKLFG